MEACNIAVLNVNFYILGSFLGTEYCTLGKDHIQYLCGDNKNDPLEHIFPKLAQCLYHTYGPAGDVNNYNGLCVLPQNDISDKIFLVLWWWLSIMIISNTLWTVFRMLKWCCFLCIQLTMKRQFRKNRLTVWYKFIVNLFRIYSLKYFRYLTSFCLGWWKKMYKVRSTMTFCKCLKST